MFQPDLISAGDLDGYIDVPGVFIIDLRSFSAYESGHIRGAIHIPYEEIEKRLIETRTFKDKLLILYCTRGSTSMKAARQLAGMGYQAKAVIGGFSAYRGRNLVFSGKS